MLIKIIIFKGEMELKMGLKKSLYKVSDSEMTTKKHQLVHSSVFNVAAFRQDCYNTKF